MHHAKAYLYSDINTPSNGGLSICQVLTPLTRWPVRLQLDFQANYLHTTSLYGRQALIWLSPNLPSVRPGREDGKLNPNFFQAYTYDWVLSIADEDEMVEKRGLTLATTIYFLSRYDHSCCSNPWPFLPNT